MLTYWNYPARIHVSCVELQDWYNMVFMNTLRTVLERFYREYPFSERMANDPVEFPHRYRNRFDIEISAFISSCLAYGRVDLFKDTTEKILSRMGASPHEFIADFRPGKHRKLFTGIKYRFNENEDILALFLVLHRILTRFGSVEAAFMQYYRPEERNVASGLSGLISEFLRTDTAAVYGADIRPAGLLQFFPSPEHGSACKRANLFLRWMIRDRDTDFGLWKQVPKHKLIIPLDTHIARISYCLRLTGRKTQDWKMAVGITESLKQFDPEDPLKYDFALCHHGISGACKGIKEKKTCRNCVFRGRNNKFETP